MKLSTIASVLAAVAGTAPAAADPSLVSGRGGLIGVRGKKGKGGVRHPGRGQDRDRDGGDDPPEDNIVIVRLRKEKKKNGNINGAGTGRRGTGRRRAEALHAAMDPLGPAADDSAPADAAAALARDCGEVAAAVGGEVVRVYAHVLHGCAVRVPAAAAASARAAMAGSSRVMATEDDGRAYAQESSPPWGLDRVNQCGLPLDGAAAKVDAAGVRVYVLDTGIYAAHDDFAGAIDPTSACHADMTDDGGDPLADRNGHG